MKARAKTLVTLLIAVMMTLAMNLSGVFAMDNDYTEITGTADIPVRKTLDLNGAAYGPTHTVTFNVSNKGTINTTPVYNAGGTMPTSTVSFSGADKVKTTTLDFSTVTFPKPGIYKFTVTETIGHNSITPKANTETSYDIYVMVENIVTTTGDSALQPAGYKIVKGSGDKVTEALFENEYTSFELDVDKKVTGNQGDKHREFTVTVAFSGATGDAENDKYKVKLVHGTPTADGDALAAPLDVAANSTVTLKLKDTDQVQFYGIPKGITYTVTETDANAAGYTTSYEGDTTFTFDDADKAVSITNDKQGSLPTGLFINNWPYILTVLVAIAAAVVFVKRRNSSLQDEDL